MRLPTFSQLTYGLFLIFSLLISSPQSFAENEKQGTQQNSSLKVEKVLRIKIDASINPATANFLESSLNKAKKENAQLFLIQINTPGGLVTTTKEILKMFGNSSIPIVVWITPSGASATSAGAIIASGSHLLYMNDGTNMGAATPIQMSGDIKQKDARNKAVNDLVALVKSLSESHGRNPKGFQKMIEEGASYTSQDAQKEDLINGIARTENELWEKMHKQVIMIQGQKKTLEVSSPKVVTVEMDPGQKLLNIFANPTTAYVLFLIGAALIYLELQAPGGLIAGGLGAVCLILAGIGFQVLPLNIGALGLILLSFVLLAVELFVTTYGILTIAALVSLISGSLFLFRTEDSYIELSHTVIFSTVGAILAFIGVIVLIIAKTQKNVGSESFNDNVGRKGIILYEMKELSDPDNEKYIYQVKVTGEFWKSKSNEPLQEGDKCVVTHQDEDEVILTIKKSS